MRLFRDEYSNLVQSRAGCPSSQALNKGTGKKPLMFFLVIKATGNVKIHNFQVFIFKDYLFFFSHCTCYHPLLDY